MKKTIVLLLAVVMMIACVIPASATDLDTPVDGELPTDYATLSNCSADIAKSGNVVTCQGFVRAKISTNLSIKLELQRMSGGAYTTIATWTKTGTGVSLSDSRTKTVASGYTYRLKATLTAGSDSVTMYRIA